MLVNDMRIPFVWCCVCLKPLAQTVAAYIQYHIACVEVTGVMMEERLHPVHLLGLFQCLGPIQNEEASATILRHSRFKVFRAICQIIHTLF